MKQGVLLKLQMIQDGISISVQEKEDMVEMENIVNNTQSGIHPEITRKSGKMDLYKIQQMVHKEYIKNGYQERWSVEYLTEHPEELALVIDLAEVGLFVTEVAELMEDIRNGNDAKYQEESADIVIRVMNWLNRKKMDLESAIMAKHKKNMKRERLHGKKV